MPWDKHIPWQNYCMFWALPVAVIFITGLHWKPVINTPRYVRCWQISLTVITSVMAIVACMRCSGMRGFGYQKRLYADLWWRNSLSSAVTVVAATAHIAEKSDRLRITLSPEILRQSNLIRNGWQISRSSSSLQVKSGCHRWWTASMEKLWAGLSVHAPMLNWSTLCWIALSKR